MKFLRGTGPVLVVEVPKDKNITGIFFTCSSFSDSERFKYQILEFLIIIEQQNIIVECLQSKEMKF